MQTPYVPRSLTFDLSHEKNAQRKSFSVDDDHYYEEVHLNSIVDGKTPVDPKKQPQPLEVKQSVIAKTRQNQTQLVLRRSSLKNSSSNNSITDQNKAVSFSTDKIIERHNNGRKAPLRRTKSQMDEEYLYDYYDEQLQTLAHNGSIKQRTPLTVRKNVKRGRASQGSITHDPLVIEEVRRGTVVDQIHSIHFQDVVQDDDMFDLQGLDDMLNMSSDYDDDRPFDPSLNGGCIVSSKQGVSVHEQKMAHVKEELEDAKVNDFSSLLSEDDDDDTSSAIEGDLDITVLKGSSPLDENDIKDESDTNDDSISLSEMIQNFNMDYEDHSQNGEKSIQSLGDFVEFMSDAADSSLDLLVTPTVPRNPRERTDKSSFNVNKINIMSPSHGKEELKMNSQQLSQGMNIQSYSDTEASQIISMEHLENILNYGGEKALDTVLSIPFSHNSLGSKEQAKESKHNRPFLGLGGKYRSKNDESTFDDGFSFHSNVENSPVVHEWCLRSNLKSALIALRSVKAERSDLEGHLEGLYKKMANLQAAFDQLDQEKRSEVLMLQNYHDIQIEQIKKEMQFTIDDLKKQDATNTMFLEEARNHVKTRTEELQRVTKRLHESALELETLQAEVAILRLAHEGMEDKSEEASFLQKKVDELDEKVSMLEVTIELKDEEIRDKCSKIVSTDALLEESVRIANNLKLEVDEKNMSIKKLKLELSSLEAQMDSLREDSAVTIKMLDSELIQAQEERKEIVSLQNQVSDLTLTLKRREIELIEKNEQSIFQQKALSEAEKNLLNVEQEVCSLKQELSSHRNCIRLQNDLGMVHENLYDNPTDVGINITGEDPLLNRVSDLESKIAELEHDLAAKEIEQDEISEALVASIEEKRQLQGLLDEQSSETLEYQRQIKDLSTELEMKEHDIKRLMESVDENFNGNDNNSTTSLPVAIEGLRAKLQISEAKLDISQKALVGKEELIHELSRKYEDAEMKYHEQIKQKESQLLTLESSLEELNMKIHLKDEENHALKNSMEKNNVDMLKQSTLNDLYAENLEKTLESAAKRIEELECKLNAERNVEAALSSANQRIKELEEERNSLQAHIEHLKVKMSDVDSDVAKKLKELEGGKKEAEVQINDLKQNLNDVEETHSFALESLKKSYEVSMVLEIERRDEQIVQLKAELDAVRQETLKHKELSHGFAQTDNEFLCAGNDAKKAISELVDELQVVTSERDSIQLKLRDVENELVAVSNVCDCRDLEIIALECSLKKAQTLLERNLVEGDNETRLVINELVHEISRMTSDLKSFKVEKDQIATDLHYSDETAELEAQRANSAELKLESAEGLLKSILKDLKDSLNSHKLRCSICISRIHKWFSMSDGSTDFFDLSLCDNCDSESPNVGNNGFIDVSAINSTIAALDTLAIPSGAVYHDAADELRDNVHCAIEPSVRYKDYERLRRKCDMLESERELLINETFALLDSSSAANAAEIAAVESKLRREALDQLDECTKRMSHYFSDRIEKTVMQRSQLEERTSLFSKSKHD